MKRKMLAGLMAAAFIFAAAPDLQAAAAGNTEISAAEIRAMDGFYKESAQAKRFPWLTVEDHRWGVRRDGRLICWGSYPEIRVEGDARPDLQRVFLHWSLAQKQQHDAYAAKMGRYDDAHMKYGCRYEYTVVERWGRVDDKIASFSLRRGYFHDGEHLQYSPIVAENIHAATGEQVSIDEVVAGRDSLLSALASAFRAQYPDQEQYLPAKDIDKALAELHVRDDWQKSFTWMLDEDNDLVVFYNPGTLAPYAAAMFKLTLQRAEFPAVFRTSFAD